MKITVIVCTYNRCRSLAITLESVARSVLPDLVEWDILVVDNNSTDETREVVEEWSRRYPRRVRYMFEAQQGISHARNAGIREAWGEILAFIDDDETAEANWLQNLTANLHTGEWIGAGGPVMPVWVHQRPSWLAVDSPFTLGPLSAWTADLQREQLTLPPVGANMAFRREAFERFGDFRTDLGRVGELLLHGEDTEFGRRLMAAGQKLRYEPSAVTHHPAEGGRLHKEYFLRWWFNKGRSDVREFENRSNAKHVCGALLRLSRDIAIEAARWAMASSPSPRFICKLKIWEYAGEGYESYSMWLDSLRSNSERNDKARSSTADGK